MTAFSLILIGMASVKTDAITTDPMEISNLLGCLPTEKCISSPYIAKRQEKSFPIVFGISNGRVENITTYPERPVILLDIDSRNPGNLSITIPRNFMDSKYNLVADANFSILMDGAKANYTELPSESDSLRLLQIPFQDETKRIQIVGNQIIPGYQRYDSSNLGITIYYPHNWERDDEAQSNVQSVILHPANASVDDMFLRISVERLADDKSLKQYTFDQFRGGMPNYDENALETSQTTIGNQSAYKVGLISNNSKNYDSTISAFRNGIAYTIQFHSNNDKNSDYLSIVSKIVGTIKFGNPPRMDASLEANSLQNSNMSKTLPMLNISQLRAQNSISDEIILLSQKLKKGSSNYNHVIGQIQYVGEQYAKFIKVRLTVYDEKDTVITTAYAYTDAEALKSNQKTTFDVSTEKENFNDAKYYELSIQWNKPDGSEGYVENAQVYDNIRKVQ